MSRYKIQNIEVESFIKLYLGGVFGCTAVKNFDDMLGKVDGIINGGYYNHSWNHILHEPYLEAGLPNLINRPFANSLAKAKKMTDLAKKHTLFNCRIERAIMVIKYGRLRVSTSTS